MPDGTSDMPCRKSAHTCTLAGLAALVLAGCGAGVRFHGFLDAGQWTPSLECSAQASGESKFDLTGVGGLEGDRSFWALEGGVRFTAPRRGQAGAYAFNLGYFQHTYEGEADLGVTGITFAGQNLTGPTSTETKVSVFKFTYEEPSGTANELTGGLLGFHFLEFAVTSRDADSKAQLSGTAPMLILGWKIAYYSNRLMYFFNIEGMDLDLAPLNNVTGSIYDTSAGVRWFIDSAQRVALTAGYRRYEARLDVDRDKFNITMDGPFISFFMYW